MAIVGRRGISGHHELAEVIGATASLVDVPVRLEDRSSEVRASDEPVTGERLRRAVVRLQYQASDALGASSSTSGERGLVWARGVRVAWQSSRYVARQGAAGYVQLARRLE